MAFKALKVNTLDAQSFNRSEQNTEAAFTELAERRQLAVVFVSSSASIAKYIVRETDQFIVVDSSGGPMKIVLPPASGPNQAVSIKNVRGRIISIAQSDGKPTGDGVTAIDLGVGTSVQMVSNGKAWYAFG